MSSESIEGKQGKSETLSRRDYLLGGGLLAALATAQGCLSPAAAPLVGDGANAKAISNPDNIPELIRPLLQYERSNRGVSTAPGALSSNPRVRAYLRDASAIDVSALTSRQAKWGTAQLATESFDTQTPPDMKRFLISRLTWGITPEEDARYDSLGYEGYLEYHLDDESIVDTAVEDTLAALPTLSMSAAEMAAQEDQGIGIIELLVAQMIRSIYSQRQLHDRMSAFWTDHFNMFILDGALTFLKPPDDRDVIRAGALGTFPDLLRDTAHSSAMLYSLDNFSSIVGSPNENYGRELLELHTLGVDGGYDYADIVAVARAFTGWTIEGRVEEPNFLGYTFEPGIHDFGEKQILDLTIPAFGGKTDGDMLLDYLSSHESTVRFISTKLLKWLWGYAPSAALVDQVANTYVNTNGDIRSMIRVMLSRVNVETALTLKYKRPYHQAVATVRATQPTVTSIGNLLEFLDLAGQIPFFWPAPNGYPDSVNYWAGLILPRWNLASGLMNGDLPGFSVDANAIIGGAVAPGAIVKAIEDRLFVARMTPDERKSLKAFLEVNPTGPRRIDDTIGLALSSPSYQWH